MLEEKRLQAGLHWERTDLAFAVDDLPLLLFSCVAYLAQLSSLFFLVLTFLMILNILTSATVVQGLCLALSFSVWFPLCLCIYLCVAWILLGKANPFPLELKYFWF